MSVLTPLAATSAATVSEVECRLERYFDEHEARAMALGGRYVALWGAMRRSARGGKKLRPALVVETFAALRGEGTEALPAAAVDVAAAFELLHTAFLLHDDVLDGDTMRRGRANLIGELAADAERSGVDAERARAWGEASAILAGDLLIHGAHRLIDDAELPDRLLTTVRAVFDDAVFRTAAGEQSDMAFSCSIATPGLSGVLAMTEDKTAHYSFGDPLRVGALLAGASDDLVSLLGEFGRAVGVAFQLRDDVLGTFGDERALGKSVASDRRNGKVTVLTVMPDGAMDARDTATGHGDPRDLAERLIAGNRDAALRLAADSIVPDRLRAVLEHCVDRATERRS
ncbi:polyprenyl synthetase family protein [Humibacter ginsenosidimutans]|uniref:Polyprenyl synthetase family protein n=1 Tax=Humibacter ginsenosidimutans TaxID=2599293 RepID=A0A5B8M5U0_9MICO|nr:polyprenyl synthetase family protein [Humibacter ginsenosidimutans]QDZ15626.1 polyprenyl synthetase family protein [Humibacter ginsenosidimutans]